MKNTCVGQMPRLTHTPQSPHRLGIGAKPLLTFSFSFLQEKLWYVDHPLRMTGGEGERVILSFSLWHSHHKLGALSCYFYFSAVGRGLSGESEDFLGGIFKCRAWWSVLISLYLQKFRPMYLICPEKGHSPSQDLLFSKTLKSIPPLPGLSSTLTPHHSSASFLQIQTATFPPCSVIHFKRLWTRIFFKFKMQLCHRKQSKNQIGHN